MEPKTFLLLLVLVFLGWIRVDALQFSIVSSRDAELRAVENQLGYAPPNFLRVSAWTDNVTCVDDGDHNNDHNDHNRNNRDPVAIQTYPLQGGAARRQRKAKRASETAKSIGTPFPTLFWLCHPAICRAIGELEQLGYVTSLQQRLNQCPDSVELFLKAHQQYATLRWSTLEVQHRTILEQNDGMRKVLQESGIAGTNLCLDQTPHIKCLHAHYAHYRSGGNNPVGLWIHQLLQKEYPDVIL